MVKVQVLGGDQLAATLAKLGDDVSNKIVRDALKAGGEPIRASAARRMKRGPDDPHAADNVVMKLGKSGHALAIGPGKNFHYWLFQEFGTTRHPAQPALRPAFDEEGPAALRAEMREFWAGIRGALPMNLPSTTSATFL